VIAQVSRIEEKSVSTFTQLWLGRLARYPVQVVRARENERALDDGFGYWPRLTDFDTGLDDNNNNDDYSTNDNVDRGKEGNTRSSGWWAYCNRQSKTS
jgi:hypothetical protein